MHAPDLRPLLWSCVWLLLACVIGSLAGSLIALALVG